MTYVRTRGLLGTGGALRLAVDEGVIEEAFFVLYGDSYVEVDFGRVDRAFVDLDLPALMTVIRNDGQWDASNAVFESGRVVRYEKGLLDSPPEMCWIDYGLSVFRRQVIVEMVRPSAWTDLSGLQTALSRQGLLAGLSVTDRFYEVGSPYGLADLETHLAQTAGPSNPPTR